MTICFQVDEPAVWSELGHAQLDNGLVAEAIASYLRSNDTSRSSDVIERSKEVCPLIPQADLQCYPNSKFAQCHSERIITKRFAASKLLSVKPVMLPSGASV